MIPLAPPADSNAAGPSVQAGRANEVSAREGLRAALVLLALLSLAYANVVFLGGSLVYTNNYNPLDYRPMAENYGPGFVPAETWAEHGLLPYVNLHDPEGAWWQWEPSGAYLHNGLLEGDWPFWDPYVGGGAPAMANLTSAFFFPPYFLIVVLGNTVFLKNVYFLAMLLAAGWFTYVVLRKYGISPLSSYLGGAVFMLSGGLSQNVGSFIGQTACCAPFVIFVTQRFLAKPSRRRGGVLAVSYAGVSLASFPPLLLAIFSFTVALVALEVVAIARRSRDEARRIGGRYAAAGTLAIGLVAFYYLPAFAAMGNSPQIQNVYVGAGLETLSPYSFWQLLAPGLVGGGDVFQDSSVQQPTNGKIPYLGVTSLFLALVGVVSGVPREARVFKAAVVLVAALVALKLVGVPPVSWIGLLPGLKTIHFAIYFGIFLDFLLALLAAFGLEALLSGRARWLPLAAAVGGGAVFLITLRPVIRLFERPGVLATWQPAWRFAMVAAALAGALILLSLWGRPRWPRLIPVALVLLFIGEGIRNTYYPRQRSWDIWRHPPAHVTPLASLAAGNRVFLAGVLTGNASSAFEIFGLDSLMTFNSPRMFELYRRYANPGTVIFLREASQVPPDGVLDRANISVVAIREAFPDTVRQAEAHGFETRWTDGYVRLFWRRSSPRYFFTSEFAVLPPPEALEAIGTLPPGRELVLESAPAFSSIPNERTDPIVRVRHFRRGSITLDVEAPRPGLVYCSESNFPGWSATVNGRPAAILPANYAFRALEVPAGKVTIELSYFPPGLLAGSVLTVLSIVVLASLVRLPPKTEGARKARPATETA